LSHSDRPILLQRLYHGNLDDAGFAQLDGPGVDGGSGECGITRVYISSPYAANLLPVDTEVKRVTDLVAKSDHVVGRFRGQQPLLEEFLDLRWRQFTPTIKVRDQFFYLFFDKLP
jgi:hypothetical protein